MQSRNLTVMFTDMKGYTSRTASNSRKQIAKLIADQDKLIRPVIEKRGGRVVKTIGDAFMAVFESPTSAVLCGVEIQKMVDGKFKLRIGINVGEVTERDGDVFGEPVNLASRVESGAEPGRVFLTDAVYQAMNKNEVKTVRVGKKWYKGIPREVLVHKVARQGLGGIVESVWPLSIPKALPLAMVVAGMVLMEWGVYQWQWPQVSLAESSDQGEVLGEESVMPAVDDGSIEELKAEFMKMLREATKSAIVVTVTQEPTPTVTATPTPSEGISPSLTPTATLTPTETIKPRSWRKDVKDWRD